MAQSQGSASIGADSWRPGWFTQAGARSHPFVIPGVIRIKDARVTAGDGRRRHWLT
jgi:hypothetical protein